MSSMPLLLFAVLLLNLQSPDTQVAVEVNGGTYGITYRGKEVIASSKLDFVDGAGKVRHSSRKYSWKPVYGERAVIPDNYRQAEIDYGRVLLTVRAYNEGAAFRYTFRDTVAVQDEQTEFRLPGDTMAWETYRAQSTYRRVPVGHLKKNCERPLTLEYASGIVAAIGESCTWDYARTLLSPIQGGVVTSLGSEVKRPAGFSTPWRYVIVGDSPGDLLERNYLLLNLCEESRVQDTSWIKPGKVIREVTLSTRGGKECVDFARKHNFQYVEYDAGWYGHEYDDASDATAVNVDLKRLAREAEYRGLDLKEVIRYAESNGIGVLLYVNRRALERQLETILPLYRSWGVKGVKYGFVNVGSHYWTRWLYDAVDLAAKNRLMVDIHDEHRPTGLSRTWPNLMTQEGILGNEAMPDATHNTVLPFTRFVAGAGDYTICWNDKRIKTTWPHQLALSVAFYSPWQFIFWYDRPHLIKEERAMEFFNHVPTVWDDTKVVDGKPGEFAAIARRSGKKWFLGVITNNDGRTVSVPLQFLPTGRKYRATMYSDGASQRDVKIETKMVTSSDSLTAVMSPGGGMAVRFEAVQ